MRFLKHLYHRHRARRITAEHTEQRMHFDDRNVLEMIIFPYILAYRNPQTILDIGREGYQTFYNEFFKGRELWTLDKDPARKEFGAEKHITDDVKNVGKHFKRNYFDVIFINGVFGWGLNQPAAIEQTFEELRQILKPGGLLMLGYNDTAELTPVPVESIKALKKFKPFYFKPLKGVSFKAATGEHTYNFYTKN